MGDGMGSPQSGPPALSLGGNNTAQDLSHGPAAWLRAILLPAASRIICLMQYLKYPVMLLIIASFGPLHGNWLLDTTNIGKFLLNTAKMSRDAKMCY